MYYLKIEELVVQYKLKRVKDLKNKVYFNVEKFTTFIKGNLEEYAWIIQKYSIIIRARKIQQNKDLCTFECASNETIFQESIDAYTSLLKAFVNDIDKNIIKEILLPLKNGRKPLPSYNESIANFEEVKKVLKEIHPPLDYFM